VVISTLIDYLDQFNSSSKAIEMLARVSSLGIYIPEEGLTVKGVVKGNVTSRPFLLQQRGDNKRPIL
jgi:hypothetical protein